MRPYEKKNTEFRGGVLDDWQRRAMAYERRMRPSWCEVTLFLWHLPANTTESDTVLVAYFGFHKGDH